MADDRTNHESRITNHESSVTLVALDRVHLARTRGWANDPDIMRLMNRQRPVSASEHEAWFESIRQRDDCAFFAVETSEPAVHVGNVWLWAIEPRHHKAELRIVIGEPSARGKGVGTEAIELLCRHGFERLGLHRIYAHVLAINPAARRAFERSGFHLEGTLRDDRWTGECFTDTYVLARLSR
jgi:RimJ/RimL family protein N-acetyltransferase